MTRQDQSPAGRTGADTPSDAWRLRPAGMWDMDRLLTAARLIRRWHQDPRHRILLHEIFPRDGADIVDRYLLQPLGPLLHVGNRHAGGEPPAIMTRHARLAVGGVDELGEIGAAGAVELALGDAGLAQL